MMKRISFLFFLVFAHVYPQADQLLYLKDVDQAPVINGCPSKVDHNKQCFLNTLNAYVAKRIILPFDENNNPIEGRVKVYMVFDKSGKLIIKAVRSSDKTLKESAETVFQDFDDFKPAVKDGKNISMMMVYPLNYTFTADKDAVFSIVQVTPPQIKLYKKNKSTEELRKLYHEYVFSKFVGNDKLKGHLIANNAMLIQFSFDIDSSGKVSNFKDLVKSGSDDEKYLNKRAAKIKQFAVPPKIGNIPVKIRDTIKMIKKGRAVTGSSIREREVIIDH